MSVNFLLTKYFYPLEKPITLSSYLKAEFDNPRTDKEIEYAKKFITDQYNSGIVALLPLTSKEDIVTLEMVVKSFKEAYSNEDEYVKNFFKGYKGENLFDYLAKMWVVIRFDDEGEVQRIEDAYQEMLENGKKGFIELDDDHPVIQNSETLINYCYLLALLSHTEGNEYFGHTLIVDPSQLNTRKLLVNFGSQLMMFIIANNDYQTRLIYEENFRWIYVWLIGSKDILCNAKMLDEVMEKGYAEKLLYVGNLLGIAEQTHDDRIKLLMLTSIIELLLTRNPDFSRYNVEDSITKQFQLKASVLIYMNNKEYNIDEVKKRLKTIYDQRSNIAHGDFKEFEKYKGKLSKKVGKEEYFSDLILDLYSYIRAIIEEYVKDPNFVEFLKAS